MPATLPRSMIPVEQAAYGAWFPALNVRLAVVTGERDGNYNCLAWTLGSTTTWPWPTEPTIDNFDPYYAPFGYTRATSGEIAIWGFWDLNIQHCGISGTGHGPRWESKDGGGLRFQHDIGELDGDKYGGVLHYYQQTAQPSPEVVAMLEEIRNTQPVASYLTDSQRKQLSAIVGAIPVDLRTTYAAKFAGWKATWFDDRQAHSSNPATRRVGDDYNALVALGTRIIPLVIESLADPANFMALQLYDVIQDNRNLIVRFEAGDLRMLTGEQGRAREVVRLWLANA